MPPHVRRRAEALLQDRMSAEPLDEFIRRNHPHEPPPAHVDPIIGLIERARHERIKVCLSLPPRHAKTVTILRGLNWWLRHEPADTCAYYSYSDTQARSKSRLCREWAIAAGLSVDGRSKSVGEWRTIQGGGLLAGGLRSGLTGQGVSGLFIVDDPIKNREEADSLLVRDRVEESFNEVVFTRLEGASVLVVHTRWHEDDLIGRLALKGWEVINIPAIAEENDYLGRVPGEALWPSRFDLAELDDIRREIGEWSFAALYQGRPRPRGTALFGDPTFYDPDKFDIRGCTLVMAADPAASEKTTADYSTICVLALRQEEVDGAKRLRAYVVDFYRRQVTVPDFVQALLAMQQKWYGAATGVEAVGGFKAVPQMLRSLNPKVKIVEIHPTRDKFQRAQGTAAAWNAGDILLPMRAIWAPALIDEVRVFTGVTDAHDDQVDALAHAWNMASAPRRRRGAREDVNRWR